MRVLRRGNCVCGRFLQTQGAAAALKARQTFEPILQEKPMPAPDTVVVEKPRRGDPLAAPTVVEQNESVGASRQAMRRGTVSRQRNRVGAIFRRKVASANHGLKRNPECASTQPFFRLIHESG